MFVCLCCCQFPVAGCRLFCFGLVVVMVVAVVVVVVVIVVEVAVLEVAVVVVVVVVVYGVIQMMFMSTTTSQATVEGPALCKPSAALSRVPAT